MLCYAMPCHAMPCHAMPCHAMPYHTMPYHAIPYHTMPYHTMPCHATLRYARLPCYATLGCLSGHRGGAAARRNRLVARLLLELGGGAMASHRIAQHQAMLCYAKPP
jgi:hypothetical protein